MAVYEAKAYEGLSEDQIRVEMSKHGYNPRRVEEPANAVYDPHKNATDLLLVYLEGSADVRVGQDEYHCTPGDRLQIPGNIEHSARVGADGVVYLMTELELIGD